MKKRSILVVLLAAALTIGNAVPAAAAPCGRGNGRCGQNYVDADGDGICDNFVDVDGDGINDNCPGYGNGQGRGNGQGYGNGQGCGNGRCGQNYVDADGDGVCDNFVDADGNGVCDNYKTSMVNPVKKAAVKKTPIKKSTIKKVQRRLNKIGYKCGKANGKMNVKTQNALKSFKKAKGLKVNSLINKATLKALRISN